MALYLTMWGLGLERVGEAWLVRDVVKGVRHKLRRQPRHTFSEPGVGYRVPKGERAGKP